MPYRSREVIVCCCLICIVFSLYFLHLLFADVLGQVKCQQTDDFLDFSIALPLPSLIFALTGLNLAYSNKQIFKLDPTTGLVVYDYKIYLLSLMHSIGSFLASIAALCLPIFGTTICPIYSSPAGYSDGADLGEVLEAERRKTSLIFLVHSFAGCLLFLLNMLSSVFGFFSLIRRANRQNLRLIAGHDSPPTYEEESVSYIPKYTQHTDLPPSYESLQINSSSDK